MKNIERKRGGVFVGLLFGIAVGAIGWFLAGPVIAESTGGELAKVRMWGIAAGVIAFIVGSTKK